MPDTKYVFQFMEGKILAVVVIILVICEEDLYFYANPLSKDIKKMTADLYLESLKLHIVKHFFVASCNKNNKSLYKFLLVSLWL